jgi:hypothetical protein
LTRKTARPKGRAVFRIFSGSENIVAAITVDRAGSSGVKSSYIKIFICTKQHFHYSRNYWTSFIANPQSPWYDVFNGQEAPA